MAGHARYAAESFAMRRCAIDLMRAGAIAPATKRKYFMTYSMLKVLSCMSVLSVSYGCAVAPSADLSKGRSPPAPPDTRRFEQATVKILDDLEVYIELLGQCTGPLPNPRPT